MSDDYLPLLIAEMQSKIAALTDRVDALEAELYAETDDEVADTYLDGTPIR